MDERTFRVDKEDIRNPNLLHEARIEGTTLVAAGGEGQAMVLPVMPQVQCHGEVLEQKKHQQSVLRISSKQGNTSVVGRQKESHTMFTSDMLSILSTWTSMPTGIAEPAKGKTS